MSLGILDRIAYGMFRRSVSAEDYPGLENKLVQARTGVPPEVYVSRVFFLSALFSLPLGLLMYALMQKEFSSFLGNMAFLAIPLLSFLVGYTVYQVLLFYPSFEAKLRGRKIDIVLPHSVALMHALSRGSSDINSFFQVIASNKKIYGEVSKEVTGVLVDTRIFNLDIKTALKNSASRTPSESFKNFLESLSTVIGSGGNLVSFFLTKSEQYKLKALDENKAFIDTIGLFSEIYVTGFAAGPLFIIVLLVVLGLVGGAKFVLLLGIVYLFIPGGSILFIIFLSSMSEGIGSNAAIKNDRKSYESKNPVIQKITMRMQVYDFLKNPLKKLIETPEKVLYVSIPAGLFFFIISTYNYFSLEFDQFISNIDRNIIITVFIVFVPYMLLIEAHSRRINMISRNFPEFLNRLASLHESGLTLPASLKKLGRSNLGILDTEIHKMNMDIELSGSIVEAFRNFGERINTVSVQRISVLIEKASWTTGNIKDSLVIAAKDVYAAYALEEERKRSTQMHVIILYIAFFVFLYVIWSLVMGFLPQIPDVAPGASAEFPGEGIAFSGVDKPFYIRLFFHASVLEGFFSGLVAGQISEGDARLGLKHSLIMVAAAYMLFTFIT